MYSSPFRLQSISSVGLLALVALLVGACGSLVPLQSTYRTAEITIDGTEADWYSVLRPAENENLSLGVANDDEFVYVALLTSDPMLTREIMARGLVLWIDPEGGKKQHMGIQYPLGFAMDPAARAGFGADRNRSADAREELFEASLLDMELVRDGGSERVRVPANSLAGLMTRASFRNGTLFYEARVPLDSGGPWSFAAGAEPGRTIGIGLQTPEPDPDARQRRMMDDAANSPMRGGGAYGSPYGGGAQRTPRIRADDAFSLWRAVTLAQR